MESALSSTAVMSAGAWARAQPGTSASVMHNAAAMWRHDCTASSSNAGSRRILALSVRVCRKSVTTRFERAFGRRWRRKSAHLKVPIGPRAGIDYPRRRSIERLPHLLVGNVLPDNTHVLVAGAAHCVSHEPDGVRERLLGVLEPDDSAGHLQHLSRSRNGPHEPS